MARPYLPTFPARPVAQIAGAVVLYAIGDVGSTPEPHDGRIAPLSYPSPHSPRVRR